MDRACEQCGSTLANRSSRARFCGPSCRAKAHKTARRNAENAEVVPIRREQRKPRAKRKPTAEPLPVQEPRGIVGSLTDSYSDDDLASPTGCIVMKLAADVDHMLPGTPGYAAVVTQLRAALADLDSRTAATKVNPLLELRKRRAADRASG
jgi:hypothetical protein